MFTHELGFQYGTIVYLTGLHEEHKQPNPQGVSFSINRILPSGKSISYCHLSTYKSYLLLTPLILWKQLHKCNYVVAMLRADLIKL